MAVGLVDLSDVRSPRFAQVNGNSMMYAASIPKLAVLLAAFQGFENRTLPQTPQIMLDLNDMIRESSNSAAAAMIERIGLSKIESLLLSPRYQFYDPRQGGGIWLGCYLRLRGRTPSGPYLKTCFWLPRQRKYAAFIISSPTAG